MKLVIDISEDDYRKAQDGRASVNMMLKAIRNGTPLPEGHGRLIDADDLEHITIIGDEKGFFKRIDAPTIIEADMAESEVEK